LIAAIDLRGRYREPFSNWEAATDAPATRLIADLDVLPSLAEAGLSTCAKDISQAGLVGTAMMLGECSRVGLRIEINEVPRPPEIALERWLQTFPSYGFLVVAPRSKAADILGRFRHRGIAAADIGEITADHRVVVADGQSSETIWDFAHEPLIGCAPPVAVA
jgi:selenophosphate synthetase-related protein